MKKENLPIFIAIGLPIFFVILISIIIFVPSLLIDPEYNFLYTHRDSSYYSYRENYSDLIEYGIVNNKITILNPDYLIKDEKVYTKNIKNLSDDVSGNFDVTNLKEIDEEMLPGIFLYDFESETSKKISLSEAMKLNLDSGPSSPDGYIVSYKNDHSGIFEIFGSSNNNRGWYVNKGNSGKKIDGLLNDDGYYNYGLKFIGWIK